MKLSPSLIYDRLRQHVATDCRGTLQDDVLYGRPEFVSRSTREFKSAHFYVATADSLPRNPELARHVLLVCVGGNPPAAFLSNRCTCFVVTGRSDIFTTFNALTAIFDEFDAWDESLVRASDVVGDMQGLLAVGEQKLDNPMLLLDETFYYLAYSGCIDSDESLAAFRPDPNGYANLGDVFDPDIVRQSDATSRDLVFMHTPHELVCSNLFADGIYVGSLTLACVKRPYVEADGFLLSHFARRIEDCMRRSTVLRFTKNDAIKSIVRNLVRSYPVDAGDWSRIENAPLEKCFVCAKATVKDESRKIPVEYICDIFEKNVRGCVAFPHEGSIVAVINCSDEWVSSGELYYDLLRVVGSSGVVVGVGSVFDDLSMARSYYRQASLALDYGLAAGGEEGLYLFDRFAVAYMVEHCSGEFSDEMLFRRGLDKLIEHDRSSQTDYVHTLRVYLDNNMHVSETARELFIHRTSLMARLKRIESIISADLSNPDDRLQLMLNLRAIEAQRG